MHRGAWRVVGAVVAVLALVGLVVLLAAGPPARTLVVAGLLVLAMVAGRAGLGHDLAEAPADLHSVGPARHGVLLINPGPGAGRRSGSGWRPRRAAAVCAASC